MYTRPVYKGITFRSNLEVEYAKFFDREGLKWEYEAVKFGRYTPDFALFERSVFVEVKPIVVNNVNKFYRCTAPLIVVFGTLSDVLDHVPDKWEVRYKPADGFELLKRHDFPLTIAEARADVAKLVAGQ